MKKAVFITGGTGFLGRQLVKKISGSTTCFVLVRTESMNKAEQLFSDLSNVKLVEGDICQTELFSFERDIKELNKYELTVIHCAALYQLDATLLDNYRLNILGTQNVLRALQDLKSCEHFIHLSSIAVAGDYSGRFFYEKALIEGQRFHSYYAKTKFDSECIVKSTPLSCQKTIIRPGVIIGDSHSGEFDKVDGPYYIIRALQRLAASPLAILLNRVGILPMPFDLDAKLPLVSVDTVVNFIELVCLKPSKENRTYQITDGTRGENVKDFIQHVCQKLEMSVDVKPLEGQWIWKKISPFLGIPQESVPYMYQNIIFDNKNIKEDYPEFRPAVFEQFRDLMIESALAIFSASPGDS